MARILILTPQIPYPPQAMTGLSQGTTIRNFNLIAGLSKRHTIDLLTFAPEPLGHSTTSAAFADMAHLLEPYCRRVASVCAPTRSQLQRVWSTISSPLPDMALRLRSAEMHRLVGEMVAANNYDVVQIEGIEMAPYTLGLLGAKKGRPIVIFDDHNAEYVLQKRAFLSEARSPRRWIGAAYSLIQWMKLTAYERRICQRAHHVVAVSEPDAEALRRLIPGLSVEVVPNGVDLEFYHPGAVPPAAVTHPHALVFTGKMDYRPNVDAVLWFANEVLPRIAAQVPDVHFYIVGQQPHARLGTLASRSDVTLTGRVPDVRPYIAAAAVYVVPLRIGGGTRLKVLEAMAMGQAIVSTRLGTDGFDLEDGRQVCFADDSGQFAAEVVSLLHDREWAARLGQAARAYVEKSYSWTSIVPHLERLFTA